MAEAAQRQSLMERNARSNEGDSPLRRLLSQLFSGWSVGGSAPGTYAAIAQKQAADQQRQRETYQNTPYEGPMDDAAAQSMPAQRPAAPAPAPRPAPQGYAAPAGSLGGMDITEGQNANIDDATRARALAWALKNQQQ